MTVRPPSRPVGAVPVGLALATLLLGACTVSGGSADAEPERFEPAPTASADVLQPVLDPPRDSREVSGDVFSLFAPAEFRQTERSGPGGVPLLVLEGPAEEPGSVVEVVAYSDPAATVPVAEQMAALSVELVDIRGASDVVRESVEWPGTSDAVLVRWTEDTATADGSVTQTFAQLAVETEEGVSATVIAVAPAEVFESSGVLDVLRSFSVERV